MSRKPDPWLRGPVDSFEPLLMPAVHALMQAREEVEGLVASVPAEHVWRRPSGAASIGFHVRHLGGALERLLTYARGRAAVRVSTGCSAYRRRARRARPIAERGRRRHACCDRERAGAVARHHSRRAVGPKKGGSSRLAEYDPGPDLPRRRAQYPACGASHLDGKDSERREPAVTLGFRTPMRSEGSGNGDA